MLRFTFLTLLATAAFCQSAAGLLNRPPAAVDKALRDRVTEFFQYHVTGDFRKAEKLVAADTQEFFYTHNKPKYLSFEITNVTFTDNYKKAKVIVICEQYVMMPGFNDKPMKVPTPSTWKIEKGKWMWYVDQEALRKSPFGTFKPGGAPSGAGLPAALPSSPDYILNQVRLEKDSIALKPGESQTVTVANGAPGEMTLSVVGAIAGVEATLDETAVKAGGKATLTIRASKEAKSGQFGVRVAQTDEVLPLRVEIKP